MALERRELKINGRSSELTGQTIDDDQDVNYNDTFGRFIKGTLITIGGIKAYKSGLLKDLVKPLKKYGATLTENLSETGYNTASALKKWTEDAYYGRISPDSKSLFLGRKQRDTSLAYDLVQDLRVKDYRGKRQFSNLKEIIDNTKNDIEELTNRIHIANKGYGYEEVGKIVNKVTEEMKGASEEDIKKEIDRRVEQLAEKSKQKMWEESHSISNSTLMNEIRYKNNAISKASKGVAAGGEGYAKSRDEIVKGFLERTYISEEKMALQEKRTGFRYVTLGDLLDFDATENVMRFQDTDTAKAIRKEVHITRSELDSIKNSMSRVKKLGEDGKYYTLAESGEWKNILIDEGLSVNSEGFVANNIYINKVIESTTNSLLNDFKLPVVGFNPIKSLIKLKDELGLPSIMNNISEGNKLERGELPYTYVSGKGLYSPMFTGQGKRDIDVDTFFKNKFDTDENFDILFSNSKAFVVGSKGTFEQIEGKFRAYDISFVKSHGRLMPRNVENLREMGGFDTYKDINSWIMKKMADDPNLNLEDIFEGDITDLKKLLGTFDPNRTIEEYEEQLGRKMTRAEKIKYEIGRRLDIGRQEIKPDEFDKELVEETARRTTGEGPDDDFSQKTNIDNLFDDLIEKVMNSKTLKTNGFEYASKEELYDEISSQTYSMAFGKSGIVFTRQAYTAKPMYEAAKKGDVDEFLKATGDFFGQHFAGFRKDYSVGERYTEASGSLFNMIGVLDRGLNSIGLGLGMESKRSAWSLGKALLLKRALPVFMLTQIPGMINYFSEPIFTSKEEKAEGTDDNIGKTFMRNVVKPIDIGGHKLGDITGFNKAMKYLLEMTPGSEHFTELPGIHSLGLGQSSEERKEYIEKGYDPVRKNRWWSASNTPFTGSKIDHWRPNIYRRVEADVKFSDTMYGSRREYYKNTWYPNFVSPLAPIRHFFTDPHHWDEKHYNDRPYAMTAPKGENIPIIGPLVGGTIGQLYQKKMHKEYWNNGKLMPVNINDEQPTLMESHGINIVKPKGGLIKNISHSIEKLWVDTDTFNDIQKRRENEYVKAANRSILDILFGKRVLERSKSDENDIRTFTGFKNSRLAKGLSQSGSYNGKGMIPAGNYLPEDKLQEEMAPSNNSILYSEAKEYPSPLQTSSLPYRDYNRYNTALDVYITPSGGTQIVDVPENLNLYKVNKEIQHYSLNKIYGTNQRVDLEGYNKERANIIEEQAKPQSQTSFDIQKGINNLADVWGLKGFLAQTMMTGQFNQGTTKIENSSYTYSGNRTFWDKNLGGLGGELSEIARRFIPKKEKDVEYLNPIRNTMPAWMPGSSYFTDYKHGDPYSKIMNGEERLPGDAYEKLNNIKFSLAANANMLSDSKTEFVRHFLHQDTNKTYEQETAEKSLKVDNREAEKRIKEDDKMMSNQNTVDKILGIFLKSFRDDDILLDSNVKIDDQIRNIKGEVDAIIKDRHSKTGQSLINIRGVNTEEFNKIKEGKTLKGQDYYEMNYDLFATGNQKSSGYIYYYDRDNPDDEIYKAKVKFNKKDLRSSIKNLYEGRLDIITGLQTGQIKRGDLYSLVDKYKILADTAPYSQEFKDISSQISHSRLSKAEREEVKAARERMQAQKEPLRVYDYKFKTSNLKDERVTVKKVIDNNTLLVEEYGRQHAIKFAGINVSESNSTLYGPTVKEKESVNKETGRKTKKRTGKTMNDAARDQIRKYIKPGSKITISYDADERNKYGKDSTESIKAVVSARGKNINRMLLDKKLATEKKDDNSPAGIRARYSKGSIAFGSMMERLTHTASYIPFIGDKFIQVRSPYEQYRKREVYNKDFKSWNHPIRDYITPAIQESSSHPIVGIMGGAFIGSFFGKGPYGKFLGTLIGGTVPAVGNIVYGAKSNKDRAWRPKRRRQQEEINTYIDTLKYVKNINLYNKYKELAKKEDNFDVDAYLEKNKQIGESNKEREKELNRYKKKVKLDYKHRKDYNFKSGEPKYATQDMSKKEIIRNINKELAEISNSRKVEKIPLNAVKAITYKQNSERTMYGYDPGDDIRNIMSALPKKERQYYSKFVKAPEEEKEKILRIAPSYLRRALQASWGMKVDDKPTLEQYFSSHALPEQDWAGWNENVDLEDVKVKMVHANNLDPGEFDIWSQDKVKADSVNIPIPKLNIRNNPTKVAQVLKKTLAGTGMKNIDVSYTNAITSNDSMEYDIREDAREDAAKMMSKMAV